MTPIDSAAFAFPEEFLPVMLIATLVTGILVACATRFKLYELAETHKMARGAIEKKGDLSYDKRYDFGTFFGFVAGAVLGIVLATIAVPQFFVNAGTWTYFIVTVLTTAVSVVFATLIFHFGVRWVIRKLAEKAVEITDTVKDAMKDVNKAVENIEDIKGTIPKVIDDADDADDSDAPLVP